MRVTVVQPLEWRPWLSQSSSFASERQLVVEDWKLSLSVLVMKKTSSPSLSLQWNYYYCC